MGLYCDETCYNLGWRTRPTVINQRRISLRPGEDFHHAISNRLSGKLNGGNVVRRLVSLY